MPFGYCSIAIKYLNLTAKYEMIRPWKTAIRKGKNKMMSLNLYVKDLKPESIVKGASKGILGGFAYTALCIVAANLIQLF